MTATYTTPGGESHPEGPLFAALHRPFNECISRITQLQDESLSCSASRCIRSTILQVQAMQALRIVSHFLGVKNAIEGEQFEDYVIYLGEILFKFPESIDKASLKFKDYDQMYMILSEGLNQLSEGKFKVLDHCLTYQDVFKYYDLEESVQSFYSL